MDGNAVVTDTQKMTLSICIVNYKTPQLVIGCLASLLPELADDATVIVADNGSQDGSIAEISSWLKGNDPAGKCRIIALPVNGGFSAGYNAAMKACAAEFYLLLNSDTVVRPGAIARLLDAAKRYPEAGLFGPRLEWPDGTPQISCFRDHSPFSELIGAAGTRHVTTLLRRFDVPMPITNGELRPPWISFAAVVIRNDVLTSAGLLDEGFFLYFEDCEYCYRARKAGWDSVYVPEARIIHLRGKSSQVKEKINTAKRLPRYYYASRTRYFRLRYGVTGAMLANIGWSIGRIISKTRETFGAKEPHLPTMGWKDIWTNAHAPLSAEGRGE